MFPIFISTSSLQSTEGLFCRSSLERPAPIAGWLILRHLSRGRGGLSGRRLSGFGGGRRSSSFRRVGAFDREGHDLGFGGVLVLGRRGVGARSVLDLRLLPFR